MIGAMVARGRAREGHARAADRAVEQAGIGGGPYAIAQFESVPVFEGGVDLGDEIRGDDLGDDVGDVVEPSIEDEILPIHGRVDATSVGRPGGP